MDFEEISNVNNKSEISDVNNKSVKRNIENKKKKEFVSSTNSSMHDEDEEEVNVFHLFFFHKQFKKLAHISGPKLNGHKKTESRLLLKIYSTTQCIQWS